MTSTENQNEECVRLFAKTLAELNSISLKQLEGLLGIAVRAVEAIGANSATSDAARFVDELKRTAAEISRSAQTSEAELYQNIKTALSGQATDIFCAVVEKNISTAMENSLANQQQLNVTGNAILAQAAALVLSSAGKNES